MALTQRSSIEGGPIDALVADLARRQHGVVSRSQLAGLGLPSRSIDRWATSGRLHRVYRGVYAVGHAAIGREGRWLAAVLAGGEGAALSHRSAGALWDLLATGRSAVEVATATTRRLRPGLEWHRCALPPDEVTTHRGIPVTTPARTLFDLAAVVPSAAFEHAVHEAEVRRLASPHSLADLLARHPGHRGNRAVRALVAEATLGEGATRSELERRFLTLIAKTGLPRPRTNAPLELGDQRFEIDFVWPSARLAVELDGHATHATRRGYEQDRARDRRLQVAGWRVVRLTWRQLEREPDLVVEDVAMLLDGAR